MADETFTVAKLIEELQKLPQDHKVFVSSDEEGNSFGGLWCVEESYFVDEGNRYNNYTVADEDVAEMVEEGEDAPGKAIILYP